MVLWSNSKPLSFNISRIGRYVKDSIIFIFGYLLKGVIITVVKKSMFELAVTVAWNSQLTYWYIITGLKKASKYANPRQVINGAQMDLMIPVVIKIKSGIQTKALGLFVPSDILGIGTAIRLRHLTYVKAILVKSVIKQHLPRVVHMGDQGRAHTFVQENVLHEIENSDIKMSRDHISEGRVEGRTKIDKKRLNFSEVLVGDKEIVEDGLLT
jgi:hypothetical protein